MKYNQQTYEHLHDELEREYFDNQPGGTLDDGFTVRPRVARVLKEGKSRKEFDNRHAALSMLYGQGEISG